MYNSQTSRFTSPQGFAAVLALFLAAFAITPAARADINLTFGTYVADKPTETVRKFRPILDALQASLTDVLGESVTITTHVARSYDDGIDDLANGRVDFARFGPASYVFAKNKQPQIQLLVMESVKGKKTFRGVICVHEDSPIRATSELKGRTFAFGSERSTIGRFLSQLHLLDSGVSAKDLGRYAYLGRHDKVGMAVGRGDFDAGALKEGTFKKLVAEGIPIRALVTFENVTKPWIARAGLPKPITEALHSELLSMTDVAALKALKKDGFLNVAESNYDIIRRAIANNGKFFR